MGGKGEAGIIDAHAVKDGGVEFVEVDWRFGDIVRKVIGFSETDATFDSPARHPHAEISGVVIASVIGGTEVSLGVNGSAEFAAPNH